MEPITDDLSLRKQSMFFIEMESENSGWKHRSDWLADNNNLASSSSDFCQGIV